jgi:putative sterol carrier protein
MPAQWSSKWSADGPERPTSGNDAEADLTLTIGTDEARRLQQGELQPSVAFMQGKLKSTGDNALLLQVLAWSATPAFADALKDWTAAPPG